MLQLLHFASNFMEFLVFSKKKKKFVNSRKKLLQKNFTQLCIVKLQTRYRLESPLKKVVVASSSEKFVYTNPGMAHGQSRKSLVSRKYPSSKHTDEWAFTKNKGRAAWPYTDTLSRKLDHIIISATS
jgi:hypothetical protein